jgi:hypothetical protein
MAVEISSRCQIVDVQAAFQYTRDLHRDSLSAHGRRIARREPGWLVIALEQGARIKILCVVL